MWLRCALLVVCVVIAGARRSPQADFVDEIFENARAGAQWRFSDDVLEDSELDVPGLITKYRYPLEIHHVTTEDGYILEMHRIPHGRDNNSEPNTNKPIVLLIHGLMLSSADYVLTGPGNAFAYILAEEGFDVWMGNCRGNYYSRRHETKNPDSLLNTAFWEFSWDEIGDIDLPTMIDFVLGQTGKSSLHFVGHSQGTTAFYVMTSLHPEYNDKIISMHSLAPVAYMANSESLILRVIAPFANTFEIVGQWFGVGEFLPRSDIFTWAGQALCLDEVVFQPICSNIIFLVAGWNEDQNNATMLPVILGHTPAGASVRQPVHYAQGVTDKGFRRYDHGLLGNWRRYGSLNPPRYDLGKTIAPVFLYYSQTDPFSHVDDVERLFRELGNPAGKLLINRGKFSHIDFLFGIDAKELLFNPIVSQMRAIEGNASDLTIYKY